MSKRIVCIKLNVISVILTANKQKLCLLLFQAQDKGRWQRLFSSFCSRTANEEEEIVHKLLGEKFQVKSQCHSSYYVKVVTNKWFLWCKLILCAPKYVVVPFIRDSWPCCVICLPQRCTKIVSVRSDIVSAVRLWFNKKQKGHTKIEQTYLGNRITIFFFFKYTRQSNFCCSNVWGL